MDSIGNQTIVVGIDGSSASDAALAWALDEASRRGLRLHVFSAGTVQTHGGDSVYDDAFVDAALAREALEVADSLLAEAVTTAGQVAPGLIVTIGSGLDGAAGALVELSARAHSIVVGHSGHGRVLGALGGAVAAPVVPPAPWPGVVVAAGGARPPRQRGGVVGGA
ncbi:MAG: universal stress protein, partial [Nocardioides sp.]|nr:universal stress protein [Nocardioides sp.]